MVVMVGGMGSDARRVLGGFGCIKVGAWSPPLPRYVPFPCRMHATVLHPAPGFLPALIRARDNTACLSGGGTAPCN